MFHDNIVKVGEGEGYALGEGRLGFHDNILKWVRASALSANQ